MAGDRELARQTDMIRGELVETIHPMRRSVRHRRARGRGCSPQSMPWRCRHRATAGGSTSATASLSSCGALSLRTLAWSATALAVAILVQAAVITAVVVKEQQKE
jgi:hypothetical protein